MAKALRSYKRIFLQYGFTKIIVGGVEKPQCVLCMQVLSNEALKESKLRRHLETKHPTHISQPISFFERNEEATKRQRLDDPDQKNNFYNLRDLNLASLRVAWRVARCKKPHTIAEDLIKPAAIDMIRSIGEYDLVPKLEMIPLSNNTIKRRITALSEDICDQVISEMKMSRFFSLQLDESTDCSNDAQLMVFVRYQGQDDMTDEFLFCSLLNATTTGEDIFNLVDNFHKAKCLSWSNCFAVTTDGAPAMLGSRRGFCARVKLCNPDVIITHCMLHRENLATRRIEENLSIVMDDIIKVVNFIKGRALNSRLFRKLCADYNADHEHLIFHSNVRWLSRGSMLKRVYELRLQLCDFLKEKNPTMACLFENPVWLAQLCYLNDIFTYLNELNVQMQGRNITIIDSFERITCFENKLTLWISRMEQNKIAAFPTLCLFCENKERVFEQLKQRFIKHLSNLKVEMNSYLPVLDYEKYFWIRDPFTVDVMQLKIDNLGFKEQLFEIQSEKILHERFENIGITKFWISISIEKKIVFNEVTKMLLPFATTYLCEAGFSALVNVKTKTRNSLDPQHDIRCALTKLEPRYHKVCDTIQSQGAH